MHVSVDDSVVLLVAGSNGQRKGVTAEGQLINDTLGVTISRDMDGTSIRYPDPPVGSFQIEVASPYQDQADVSLSYAAAGRIDELAVPLFVDGTQDSFTVTVDAVAESMLTLVAAIPAPGNLTAEEAVGNTLLHWEVAVGSVPAGFRIYSRDETETFFTMLATVSGSERSFQTSHPFTTPRRLYAISSVDGQGNESVLSETIDNNLQVITSHSYLHEAIAILQTLAGMEPAVPVSAIEDVNGDQRLGLEEVFQILKQHAE